MHVHSYQKMLQLEVPNTFLLYSLTATGFSTTFSDFNSFNLSLCLRRIITWFSPGLLKLLICGPILKKFFLCHPLIASLDVNDTCKRLIANLMRHFCLHTIHKSSYTAGVVNLSLVAGQKQTLQGMASRTNFPPTIPFPLLLLNLGNLLSFNQIDSDFAVRNESPKFDIQYIYSTVRFLISSSP